MEKKIARVCPRCGAETLNASRKCWQCKKPLPQKTKASTWMVAVLIGAGALWAALAPEPTPEERAAAAARQIAAAQERQSKEAEKEKERAAAQARREQIAAEASRGGITIEPSDVEFLSLVPVDAVNIAATLVKARGYACDSVSSARKLIAGRGYNLHCNSYRYSYTIEDRGGNWVVSLD